MARILIVDDSPTVVLVTRRILAAVGHVVESVSALCDLHAAIHQDTPDLILLDLELPGASETDLADALGVPRPRILVHSSRPLDEMVAAAAHLGAFGVLPKGSSPGELQDAVRRALVP